MWSICIYVTFTLTLLRTQTFLVVIVCMWSIWLQIHSAQVCPQEHCPKTTTPPTLYFTDMYREVCKSACKLNNSIAQLVRAWQALSLLWVSFWVSSHTGLQVYLCTDHLEEYNMSNLIACSLWAYLIGRATIRASQEVCSTPRVYKSVQLPYSFYVPLGWHRGISSEYA